MHSSELIFAVYYVSSIFQITLDACNVHHDNSASKKYGYKCEDIHILELDDQLKDQLQEKSETDPISLTIEHIEFNDENDVPSGLARGWFKVDVSIEILRLKTLEIISIENDAFNAKQFTQTIHLQIFDAPIETLSVGAFNGLANLKILSIGDVQLVEIGENILAPVVRLEKFKLDTCGSSKIKLDNFFGTIELMQLTDVKISKCKLTDTITNTTFTGLRNVEELILRSNEIKEIGPQSFDIPLKTLDTLDLSWNMLKTLPKHIFETNRETPFEIELVGNLWYCDCAFEHFRVFLNATTNIHIHGVICKEPAKYASRKLNEIKSICEEIEVFPQNLDWYGDSEQIQSSENSTQTEIDAQKTNKHNLTCEISNENQTITLNTLPPNQTLSIHNQMGELFLSIEDNARRKSIFLFEHSVHMIGSDTKINRIVKCSNEHKDWQNLRKIQFQQILISYQNPDSNPSGIKLFLKGNIQSILESFHMYRVCTRESMSINCLTFLSDLNRIKPFILVADKGKYISIFVVVLLIAFAFGIGASFLGIKIYRIIIFKRQLNLKPVAILTLKDVPPPVLIGSMKCRDPLSRNQTVFRNEQQIQMNTIKRRIRHDSSEDGPSTQSRNGSIKIINNNLNQLNHS